MSSTAAAPDHGGCLSQHPQVQQVAWHQNGNPGPLPGVLGVLVGVHLGCSEE